MAYVGLSRARRLDKIYLIEFDPTTLECCIEAFNEYIRLYNKASIPHTFPKLPNVLPNEFVPSKNLKPTNNNS